jgi:hypothetical protein
MDHRTEIELALVQVHRAARARRIQLGAATAVIATAVTATSLISVPAPIEWTFDGIGTTVGVMLGTRALRYPRTESEMSYLTKSYLLTESGKVPR